MSNGVNNFSIAEEIWHAVTHGVGFFLSIAALVLLILFAYDNENSINMFSAIIYGSALVVMYGSSTLYHAIRNTELKRLFQKFDHSAIYFLIAGSYTPIVLVAIGGETGWIIFLIEWTIAIIGIALKFIYPGRFEALSLVAYVLMGWLIVVILDTLRANIDPVGFWLIAAGGASYTGGVAFYIKDHIKYFHAVWHLFVMTGSILQFLAVLLYII